MSDSYKFKLTIQNKGCLVHRICLGQRNVIITALCIRYCLLKYFEAPGPL